MPRVMCVHFPHWGLQRIWRHRPELRGKPLAITRPVANKGSKVIACCPAAVRHGVRPGMVHAEALAMLPSLTCMAEDLDGDRDLLTEGAEWAQRFSPIVGLEEAIAPTSLFIDTTGCAACFGGEDALLRKACEEFNANGWTTMIALADTIGAAWALAHYVGRRHLQLAIDNYQLPIEEGPVFSLNLQLEIVNCQLSIPLLGVPGAFSSGSASSATRARISWSGSRSACSP